MRGVVKMVIPILHKWMVLLLNFMLVLNFSLRSVPQCYKFPTVSGFHLEIVPREGKTIFFL